jgi:hypothetical protein
VTFSTKELKDAMGLGRKSEFVCQNAVDESFTGLPVKDLQPKNSILWRGSHSHERDLFLNREPVIEFSKSHPEICVKFFGLCPSWAPDLPNWEHIPFTDGVHRFFNILRFSNPFFMFFPLEDTHFNRCKSAIVKIDAALAQTPLLSESWFHGCRQFSLESMENALKNGDLCDSWEEIKGQYNLSFENEVRREIIESA